MVGIDSCVADILNSFNNVVEQGLTQSEASQAESEVLREKFNTVFSDNIRLGLAKVFGTTAQAPPETEVTIDELMEQEDALLSVVGRRSRYPSKAASLLAMTLKKNRVMLKGLKVKITKDKVDLSGVKEGDVSECFNQASKNLKRSKDLVVESSDKTSRLVDSYKILKNAEEACFES